MKDPESIRVSYVLWPNTQIPRLSYLYWLRKFRDSLTCIGYANSATLLLVLVSRLRAYL